MLEEHVEQGVAFGLIEADDGGGEATIDEERLASGLGVGAHDRMFGAREGLAGFLLPAETTAIDVFPVMDGGEGFEEALHRRGQTFIGGVHVGEHRIAAAVFRRFVHVEDGAHRGFGVAGDVGMPDLSGDALGVLVGLDEQDFGVALEQVRRRRVDVELAETAAELLVLLGRHFLIAEEDDDVFHQRVVDGGELFVGEVTAEIDAEDLRTDGWGKRADFDRLGGHFRFPVCLFA